MISTESALVQSFEEVLHSGVNGHDPDSRILLREVGGLQGRADLVHAHIRPQALPDVPNLRDLATALNSPTKARLLAILRYGAPRSRAYLGRATGLSDHSLGGHIRQLESVGLVKVHGNLAVSLRYRLPWSMVDIRSVRDKALQLASSPAPGNWLSFLLTLSACGDAGVWSAVRQETRDGLPQQRDRANSCGLRR